ncbi:MAG: hypothetical protein H6719_19505 [Sandaracinaceae bacterium]|nr:hypothetical protein [Sandaracinaceae bacterium]
MLRLARSAALAVSLVLGLTTVAAAQVSTVDRTAALLASMPPTPISMGVGDDFGGMIGADIEVGTPIQMNIDSDVLGRIIIDFDGMTNCMSSFRSNYDVGVIYIDSVAGGIASTATLDDVSDPFRAAVSGGQLDASGGSAANVSTLTFPAGFRPDYAIAFLNPCDDDPSATLYTLQAGLMPFTSIGGFGDGGPTFVITLDEDDIGLQPGETFRYVATVLNIRNGYRGNEFQGLASAPATIGTNPFAIPSFGTFTTVGPILINELDSDTAGTDMLEFVELLGPPNVLLTGTSLIFFNGASDTSYGGVDLDGLSTNASGFLVAGNAGVTPAPAVTWADNFLQNGADAVGFYLAALPRSPIAVTATNLVDAVVYDTNDGDDAGLLTTLLNPGEPQIDEDGRASRGGGKDGDSINRCPPATTARVTSGWLPNPPTPGAANDCSVCGDGTVEGPEQCEPTRIIVIGGGMAVLDCCDPFCRFRPSTTSCRASADDCDAEERCTGSSATCPADGFLSGSTVCRPPADLCDVAETCSGTGPACPPDGLAGSSRECRAAVGPCDAPEVCDGIRPQCPADAMAPAMTACRVAVGMCDAAEVCDGSSPTCPADGVLAAGTACRASAGDCDVAEVCDGSATACPADGFADMTTVCRASTGACDVEEVCAGTGATCPMDMTAADGTACSDGSACNGTETCRAGACATGSPLSCDDRDLCTADSCAEPGGCMNTPVAGCCNIDADCDDGDVCTADTCSGPGGTCSASPITSCCTADADCDDGNSCTADACDATTNRCTRTPVASCCAVDSDCNDGNACTADACDASSGTCSNTDVAGCCLSNGDCNDGNTCTLDACDTAAMTCSNDSIAGCCTADTDCDDGDECTTDTCDTGTATCSSDRIPGCGRDAGTGFDDGGLGGDGGATDAGFDAGPTDGAVGAGGDGSVGDAGTDTTDGGCGCRAASPRSDRGPLALLLGLGAVVLWRRRR